MTKIYKNLPISIAASAAIISGAFALDSAITNFGYVQGYTDSNLTIFNISDPTKKKVLNAKGASVGADPRGLYFYSANTNSANITKYNALTGASITTVAVGTTPEGMAVSTDGTKAYTVNYGSGTVSVVNTVTNALTTSITVDTQPLGVTVSPDGTKAYTTNQSGGTVSVINTATNAATATITVGTTPYGLAVSPDSSKVYVANYGSGTVSVINASTNAVTATITVGTNPTSIAVNYDGSKVYVANIGSNTVTEINTTDNSTQTITGVSGAEGISISPDGSKIYVTHDYSNTLYVIDAATRAVQTYTMSTFSTSVGTDFSSYISPNLLTGTLSVGSSSAMTAKGFSNYLNMAGGTLRATGSFSLSNPVYIHDAFALTYDDSSTFTTQAVGVVDTNGFDMTLSGAVTGTGDLNKTGSGILTLSGTDSRTARTNVQSGTLKRTSTFDANVTILPNAVLAVSLSAGDVNISSGASLNTTDINATVNKVYSDRNITMMVTAPAGATLTARSLDTSKATVTLDANGTLHIAPYVRANGTTSIELNSTVASVTTSRSVNLSFYSADNAPVLTAIADVNKSMNFTDHNITLSATDADGDVVVYSADCNDTSKATVSVSGSTLTVRAINNATGTVTIDANATANGLTHSRSFTLTIASAAADTTPNAFTFAAVTGASLSTAYTSSSATIGGINSAADINITGGSYRINGGAWSSTNQSAAVNNGDTVEVKVTSSSSYSTAATATLTVGGVSASYGVTTGAAPASSSGGGYSYVPPSTSVTTTSSSGTTTAYDSAKVNAGGFNAATGVGTLTTTATNADGSSANISIQLSADGSSDTQIKTSNGKSLQLSSKTKMNTTINNDGSIVQNASFGSETNMKSMQLTAKPDGTASAYLTTRDNKSLLLNIPQATTSDIQAAPDGTLTISCDGVQTPLGSVKLVGKTDSSGGFSVTVTLPDGKTLYAATPSSATERRVDIVGSVVQMVYKSMGTLNVKRAVAQLATFNDFSRFASVEIVGMTEWQRFEESVALTGDRKIKLTMGSANIIADGTEYIMRANEDYTLPMSTAPKAKTPQLFTGWNLIGNYSAKELVNPQTITGAYITWTYANGSYGEKNQAVPSCAGFWAKMPQAKAGVELGDLVASCQPPKTGEWSMGVALQDTTIGAIKSSIVGASEVWIYKDGWIGDVNTSVKAGVGYWAR